MEDNWSRQADEVEALGAIFGDDWRVEDSHERRFSMRITDGAETPKYEVQLQVTFSDEYPSDAPPVYEISAPWLRGVERHKLDSELMKTHCDNVGEPIVFKWIDVVREFLEKRTTDAPSSSPPTSPTQQTDHDMSAPSASVSSSPENVLGALNVEHSENEDDVAEFDNDEFGYKFDPTLYATNHHQYAAVAVDHKNDIPLPEIFHGPKVLDRKSVFVGHLAAVTHKQQVDMVLSSLKEDRKVAAATHNIIAFRIDGGNGVWITGCADDGEIHAGSRMLHLLDIMDARNVMVVVTRWYGGIHLGPDRFKHINNCTRNLLEEHGYIKDKGDKKGPKTSVAPQQNRKKKR